MDILSFFPESILILKTSTEDSDDEEISCESKIVYQNSIMENLKKLAVNLYWNGVTQRFIKKIPQWALFNSNALN
jgi:hypothetical protein